MAEEERFMQDLREYNRLYKEFNELYHHIAKRLGLSDSAFDILYAVYTLEEGCRQSEIASYSCCSKTTINSAVKKLEKEGILRVERKGARESRVFLTPAGRALVDDKIAKVVAAEQRALLGTNPAYRLMIWGQMDQFAENLRKETEDLR